MTEPFKIPGNSLFDEPAAQRLAQHLTRYWRSQGGASAKFWPERDDAMSEPHTTPGGVFVTARKVIAWGVRSNLVNGLPPRAVS